MRIRTLTFDVQVFRRLVSKAVEPKVGEDEHEADDVEYVIGLSWAEAGLKVSTLSMVALSKQL